MKFWTVFAVTFTLVAVSRAEQPDYYRLLADDYHLPNEGMIPSDVSPTIWKPTAEDLANGFAAALANVEETPSPHWLWKETSPRRDFLFISQQKEYRAQALAVRMSRNVEGMTVECSDLFSETGDCLSRENVDVRVIKNLVLKLESGPTENSNLLVKAGCRSWPADFTAYYWLTVYTPDKTAPGLYRGHVTVASQDGGKQILPVKLRVLGKTYAPPEGQWGMWLPGHFYRKHDGYCVNYAPEWWTADRIGDFYRFWKTRGFNSPTYSGWYPDIQMIDGEIQIDFTEMDAIVKAPALAGLGNHAVIGDTLLFEYWAHTAALHIASAYEGRIPVKGNLGVRSAEGRNCKSSGKAYGNMEAELYVRIMRKIVEHAREANWPKVCFYPEEEIGNQPYKVAGYDFFMPLLKKTVGADHCVTVDNNIGHNNERLDRGERDGGMIRSYNAWDQQAIDAARRDGAAVWTFNRGFTRSAWGHYLARIGATGFHQWADQWNGYEYGVWYNSILTGNGKVLTSVNYERAALGLRDLALLRELEGLGNEYAEELKRSNDIIRLELQQNAAAKYYQGIKDSELEARRWQVLLALARAGRCTLPAAEEMQAPIPALVSVERLDSVADFTARLQGQMLESVETAGMTLDGQKTEAGYQGERNRVADFHWTKERENQIRAQAASDEEFERIRPLPYQVAVTHSREGLYFHFRADGPEFDRLARNRLSNDVALWEDDCFDIFLQTPGNNIVWQLIFNTANQTLWLKDEAQVIMNSGIKVVTVPDEDGTGYQQEVFIPYSALELTSMPSPGTVWKMNMGRELRLQEQYTTWSQCLRNFGIGSGLLKFVSPTPEIEQLQMGNGKAGRNCMSGKVKRPGVLIVLRTPGGTAYETVSDDNGCFVLNFPVESKDVGSWMLTIGGKDGTVWCQQPWTVEPLGELLGITAVSPVVISGDRLYFDAEFALGNAEKSFVMTVALVDEAGHETAVPAAKIEANGKLRFYLSTAGMPAGNYRIKASLDVQPDMQAVSSAFCRILPTAW